MKRKIVAMICVAVFLSGCGESMYEKCVSAEKVKFNALQMPERFSKYSEHYGSGYNFEVANLFKKTAEATVRDAQEVYDYRSKHLYTDDLGALLNNIQILEDDPALTDLNVAKEAWLNDKLSYEKYKEVEEKCHANADCSGILVEIDTLRTERNNLSNSYYDLEAQKFASTKLSRQLTDKLDELIKTYTYGEMLSLLPRNEDVAELRSDLDKEPSSDKIDDLHTMDLLEYFLHWELTPEGIDEDEPFPYVENSKRWAEFEGSGRYDEAIAQRLSVFITEPDSHAVAIQICNERGLYE